MKSSFFACISPFALGVALAVPTAAIAQDQSASEDGAEAQAPAMDNVIVVEGTRVPGQLDVEQAPIAEFNEADIAAFGGSSIADIIAAIEPATGSGARGSRGGGRPVFLVNGIRVSSFREFRSYPPEAVRKVEVFPEETAQRFGYPPDQRVVNIILKPNFQSLTAELEYEQPDRGGYSRNEQEATYLRIGEKGRLNFNVDIEDTSMLTEAERGLTVEGEPGEAQFRSLVPDTMSAEATANYARAFMESGTSISLNGTVNHAESRSLSGLSTDGTLPLERRNTTDTYSTGGTLNKPLGRWNANYTLDATRTVGTTEIDRRDGDGFDIADSRIWSIVNNLVVNGTLFELPAGDVSTSFNAGLDWKRIQSADTRADSDLSLTRRRVDGGVNVTIPVAERGGAWGAVGDVSFNLSVGAQELSDFGLLTNWSAGVNWGPFENLSFSATRIRREVAPTLSNLGSPRVDEFNVPVFDYSTGNTVLVTQITGGNPDLVAETQADWKFSANWELPFWEDSRLQVDYGINRSRNVTSIPGFSAAFEQAFPDRVTRDSDGKLLAIDRRPLTLFQTRSPVLSFGLNTRGQIGPEPVREDLGDRGNGRGGRPTGGSRLGFDPARMQAMRATFCKAPEGEMPDLSQIPEQFRARLLDDNGNPDPAKVASARERMCGAEAEQRSERFAAMRTAICADPPKLDGLPEQMLARLKGEDGEIDPDKLKLLRERMCSADGGQEVQARGSGGRRGGMPGFGRFGGRGDGDTRPRYFLSLNHDIVLENEVLLSQDGLLFDQLDGEVLSGGAIAQHSSRLEGGLFWQGYGFRLSGKYTGKAEIRGSEAPGSNDLFFGDLATFDVRLFANLGEALKKDDGWMKGLRIALVADNIFDARRSVVDETGTTPDAYAPFRIDPMGRYLGIDIRKVF